MYDGNHLQHYGILGMRWGHRKSKIEYRINKDYQQKTQDKDKLLYGRGGVKRISKDMDKGKTHRQASRRELGRNAAALVTLAVVATAAAHYKANPGSFKKDVEFGKKVADSMLSKIGINRLDVLDNSGKILSTKLGKKNYTVRNAVAGLIKS
jgi:phosphosulfolactate synthase (CoM biosynthesis protein A)